MGGDIYVECFGDESVDLFTGLSPIERIMALLGPAELRLVNSISLIPSHFIANGFLALIP